MGFRYRDHAVFIRRDNIARRYAHPGAGHRNVQIPTKRVWLIDVERTTPRLKTWELEVCGFAAYRVRPRQ